MVARSDRDALHVEDRRDVVQGKVLDRGENQDLSLRKRKTLDGALEPEGGLPRRGQGLAVGSGIPHVLGRRAGGK